MDAPTQSPTFVITTHAINRFRERFAQGPTPSITTIRESIQHACTIARPPSAKQLRWITSKGGAQEDRCFWSGVMLWCPVVEMVICCRRGHLHERLSGAANSSNVMVVTTVFPCPSDDQITEMARNCGRSRFGRRQRERRFAEQDSCTN